MTEVLMLIIFVLQIWILWDQKLNRDAIEMLIDALMEDA